jgi:hypothetical protein
MVYLSKMVIFHCYVSSLVYFPIKHGDFPISFLYVYHVGYTVLPLSSQYIPISQFISPYRGRFHQFHANKKYLNISSLILIPHTYPQILGVDISIPIYTHILYIYTYVYIICIYIYKYKYKYVYICIYIYR